MPSGQPPIAENDALAAALPLVLSERLEDLGRARRWAVRDDPDVEVWCVPASIGERLVDFGTENIGGFTVVTVDPRAHDDEGALVASDPEPHVWLARRAARRTVSSLAPKERVSGGCALAIVTDLAIALAACERAGLFPGALAPRNIALPTPTRAAPSAAPDRATIEEEGAWLVAEPLVQAIVGADARHANASGSAAPSPKWIPPEQASGAPWDAAANRYVLGLVAYRLLAGVHPFRGGGLRHALEAQAQGDVPPFEDDVANALKPGVLSFVLRLLDCDKSRRPPSAAAIVERCRQLRGTSGAAPLPREARVERASPRRRPARSAASTKNAVPLRIAQRYARPLAWMPLFAGVALVLVTAAWLLGESRASPDSFARKTAIVGDVRPLGGTSASECASCHSREVAEWQRSVMAHAAKSPLYGALESEVQEEVGKDDTCPNGAGVLRKAGADACRDPRTGIAFTESGGEHWCVNCHAPGENLLARMPAWSAFGDASTRVPMKDLLPAGSMEGISCAACHQTIGPVGPHRTGRGVSAAYEGNAIWLSAATGAQFVSRPEDDDGRPGIANSGYLLDATSLLPSRAHPPPRDLPVHLRPTRSTTAYLSSSEFCGACHDVRLFGTDVLGARDRGEHFKRLRNAYSEWRSWADAEKQAGRAPATCQGCHMSLFPGTCEPGNPSAIAAPKTAASLLGASCPNGTHFVSRAAGEYAGAASHPIASHYFTSVDLPLTPSFPDTFADDLSLDASNVPVGLRARRDMLLRKAFTFALAPARRSGSSLEIPITIENTGAGHRVPAGFSQEREIWVELSVTDARGDVVYEVGKLAGDNQDLRDKVFLRINVSDSSRDARGRPLGVFGADVADGPDAPRWSPNPARGGTNFRGRGLVNFQNGFLRCVRCIGTIDSSGACQPGPGQSGTRAARFDDGLYDVETGECRSNLSGDNALFETYFPVGALDAERGVAKAPDAIIDTRLAAPLVPVTYTYLLDVGTHPAPFRVHARLRFRAFPPYLVRAFADYEALRDRQRQRPSGPQVTAAMLQRIEPVDLVDTAESVP